MSEYNETEWQEKLKQDRLEHLKKTSPTLLQRVQKAFSRKTEAETALVDATAQVDLEARIQAQYNTLERRKEELKATLDKGERLLKSLPAEIKAWEITVRNYLLVDGIPAQTQKHHAAGQVACLRVLLEQLPETLKDVRQQIAGIQREMALLQKQEAA